MKFGKQLAEQQAVRSDLRYFDYNVLKGRLKVLVTCQQEGKLGEAVIANTGFDEELARQISEANICFAAHHQELLQRTAAMAEGLRAIPSDGGSCSSTSPGSAANVAAAAAGGDAVAAATGGMGSAEGLMRFVQVLRETDELRKFAVWNAMAVVKILKKRRKQAQNFASEDAFGERQSWLSRQTFFSGSDFAELQVTIESVGDLVVRSELVPGKPAAGRKEADQCPICYETIADLVELSCGHRFCWKCFVLGPIAQLPGEYRITQCPLCRQDATLQDSGDSGGAGGNGHFGIGSGSEGLLTRFFHTYFPQGMPSAAGEEDGDGHAWSQEQRDEDRNLVEQFVKALVTDLGEGAAGSGSSPAAGSSSAPGLVPQGNFYHTLPSAAKLQQDKSSLATAQKVAWMTHASRGPLALGGATTCYYCDHPLVEEEVLTTPCKHHFHKACLMRSVSEPKCPLCQVDLPWSLFLREDHPCIERGFRVVQPVCYKPDFPGGPSRGSRGYPLRNPPPMELFGGGGVKMKSYLHALMPSAGAQEEEVGRRQTDGTAASEAETAAPAAAAQDEAGSSGSDTSSEDNEESCSEEGDDGLERRWVWSAVGRIRLLPYDPDAMPPVLEDSSAIAAGVDSAVEEAPAAGSGASASGTAARQRLALNVLL